MLDEKMYGVLIEEGTDRPWKLLLRYMNIRERYSLKNTGRTLNYLMSHAEVSDADKSVMGFVVSGHFYVKTGGMLRFFSPKRQLISESRIEDGIELMFDFPNNQEIDFYKMNVRCDWYDVLYNHADMWNGSPVQSVIAFLNKGLELARAEA